MSSSLRTPKQQGCTDVWHLARVTLIFLHSGTVKALLAAGFYKWRTQAHQQRVPITDVQLEKSSTFLFLMYLAFFILNPLLDGKTPSVSAATGSVQHHH